MSRKIPLSDEEEKDFAEVPYHEFRIDDSTKKVARRVVRWPF